MVRRRLSGSLTDEGVAGSVIEDAALVLSELLSNALRHARPLVSGLVRVTWQVRKDCVEIAVSDGGSATEPGLRRPRPEKSGGHGLEIVERLSRNWGVAHENGATTVWAKLPTPVRKRHHNSSAIGLLPEQVDGERALR